MFFVALIVCVLVGVSGLCMKRIVNVYVILACFSVCSFGVVVCMC